jgi:hypothetical protein
MPDSRPTVPLVLVAASMLFATEAAIDFSDRYAKGLAAGASQLLTDVHNARAATLTTR